MDFLQVFYETRVMMSRHISNEEKDSVVEHIKSCIGNHKATILSRPQNVKFFNYTHLDKTDIFNIIFQYLQPKNIIGVIPNNNYPSQGSPELYLIRMYIKKYSAYIKVDLEKDSATFISLHSLTGTLDRDFQQASDYQENNLIKTFVWEWKQKYNEKAPAGFEIESSFIHDNYVHFDFACGEVNYENVKSFINILIDSKPHRLYDIDEQCGHIQLDIVAGGIEIGLAEK